MIKITGLDKMQKELQTLSEALESLDGELGSVRFDPNDPLSIETAVTEMEAIVDAKVARFLGNDTVRSLAENMKLEYREAILEKAAEARLEQEEE